MIKNKFSWGIIFIFVILNAYSKDKSIKWGKENHGLKMSISIKHTGQQNSFERFYPIPLTIKIQNLSDKEILIYRVNKYSDYFVSVWDEQGKKVDLTNFGKKMQEKSKRSFLKLIKEILRPNSEMTDTIRLNGLYDLTLSRKYHVKVEKKMYDNKTQKFYTVISNTISINL